MKKEEFISKLNKRIEALPDDEVNNAIEYYSELIDDKIDEGEDEEEVIEKLGDIESIARRLNVSEKIETKEDVLPKNNNNSSDKVIGTIIEIVSIVGLAILTFGIVCGIFILIVLMASIGICGLSFVAVGFAVLTSNGYLMMLLLGLGLVFIGFGFITIPYLIKLLIFSIKKMNKIISDVVNSIERNYHLKKEVVSNEN